MCTRARFRSYSRLFRLSSISSSSVFSSGTKLTKLLPWPSSWIRIIEIQPLIVSWTNLDISLSSPPTNGSGFCRLLNIHYVPCSIHISVKMFITLGAVEIFSTLSLCGRSFILHTHSSFSTNMTGLRSPCGIHQPDTSILMTKGFPPIANTFYHHPPQVGGEVPAVSSHTSLPLEGAEVFKIDCLHAMLFTEPHGFICDLLVASSIISIKRENPESFDA